METNDQLLHDMIRIDKVNRHKENEIEFEDWQIEVIKKTVDEKAWKLYSKLDYETQLSPLPARRFGQLHAVRFFALAARISDLTGFCLTSSWVVR